MEKELFDELLGLAASRTVKQQIKWEETASGSLFAAVSDNVGIKLERKVLSDWIRYIFSLTNEKAEVVASRACAHRGGLYDHAEFFLPDLKSLEAKSAEWGIRELYNSAEWLAREIPKRITEAVYALKQL